ncbi:MAG: hypothetical protein LBQ43_01570 [Holosporales bacterium]|jgi:hypothetical protein|nr:hypothetical protein [Holosporales bacterium]
MTFPEIGDFLELLNRYPAQFLGRLLAYGKGFAHRILDEKRFHLFDPMVSDRSCQLRVTWIACFARQNPTCAGLSDNDFIFFGLACFLTETVYFVDHGIIGHVPFRSNVKLWPDELPDLGSARQRNRFFGVAKNFVQARVLSDLARWFSEVPSKAVQVNGLFKAPQELVKGEILDLFENLPTFSYSEVSIPLLHFFPGLIVVTTLVSHFKLPLSILLRKANYSADGTLFSPGKTFFNFMYDANLEEFVPIQQNEINEDDVVVVFSSHYYANGSELDYAKSQSFVNALNNLFNVQASLLDYVYAMTATHAMLKLRDSGDELVTIENSPNLTKLTQQYFKLAKKVDLSVRNTVFKLGGSIDNKFCNVQVSETPFEVTHVLGASVQFFDMV